MRPDIRDVRPPDDFDPAMPDFIPTAFGRENSRVVPRLVLPIPRFP
jgi:hypothetical protein